MKKNKKYAIVFGPDMVSSKMFKIDNGYVIQYLKN